MSSPKVLALRNIRKPKPAGKLLSLTQVCEILGTRERYVYALAEQGLLDVRWLAEILELGNRPPVENWRP
jgi:hypothetical protein